MNDPRSRLWVLFWLGIAVLVLEHPLPLALVAAGPLVGAFTTPAARGWRLRMLGVVLLFAWVTALSQGLFYREWPRTPLVELGPVIVSREGVIHGLAQSLRFIGVFAAGLWVSLSTPVDRLLGALQSLRLPHGLALMGVTVVRFVPAVGAEWSVVRTARAARGRPLLHLGPWGWLRAEVSMLRPVVARSLRRARTLAESLETRGFHATAVRSGRLAPWPRAEQALCGLVALVVTGLVASRMLYVAYVADLYGSPSLRWLYAAVRAWM